MFACQVEGKTIQSGVTNGEDVVNIVCKFWPMDGDCDCCGALVDILLDCRCSKKGDNWCLRCGWVIIV